VIWAKSSWNGDHEKACEALGRIASWAKDAVVPDEPVAEATVRRLAARCAELRSYIENNEGALIDYGQRPSRQADLDLTCGRHGQSAGQRAHEQATANALVAPRRPSCASD